MGTPIYKTTEYVNWRGKSAIYSTPMSGPAAESSTPVNLSNYYTKSELQTQGLASVNFANLIHAYHNNLLGLQGGSANANVEDIDYVQYIESGYSYGVNTYRKGVRYGQLVIDRAKTVLAFEGIGGTDWENLKSFPVGYEYFHLTLAEYSRVTSWKFQNSIVEESTGVIHLDGDEDDPGLSKYYGTDAEGIKGFYDMSAGGVLPEDAILKWDAVNHWYAPYSSQVAGTFDTGNSYPIHSTRLNYDGYLYSNQSYANVIFTGAGSGSYVRLDNYLFWMFCNDTVRLAFQPSVADLGATPYVFDTANALTQIGTKLLSVANRGVEKFYIDKEGEAYANGVHLGAGGGGGVTPVDHILDWDSVNSWYAPYATQVSGGFDSSATTPVHTARLNYDGYFHATKLYIGDTEVKSCLPLIGGAVTGYSSFIINDAAAGLLTSLYANTINSTATGAAVSMYAENSATSFGYIANTSSCYFAGVGDTTHVNNYGFYIMGNISSGAHNLAGIAIEITNSGSGEAIALDIISGSVKMVLPNAAGTNAVRYNPTTKVLSYN
jgi:hypothetical protein